MIVPFDQRVADAEGARQLQTRNGSRPFSGFVATAAWIVFLFIHCCALLFYGVSAYVYATLRSSGASFGLEIYHIGIEPNKYAIVAVGFGIVAGVHAWCTLQMLVASIQARQLIFSSTEKTRTRIESTKTIRRLARSIYSVLSCSGKVFGINGPCFDLVLLVREVIESALQTYQAYRMSLFLSRQWLNQLFVGLLVTNCWSTAAVHMIFHRPSTRRYFVTLLCDLALDLMASLGVPLVLVLIYMKDIEPGSPTMFGIKWYEDVWATNAIYEFNITLVTSLSDMVMRLVFANSMITTLSALKQFLKTTSAIDLAVGTQMSAQLAKAQRQKIGSTTIRALKASNEAVKSHSAVINFIRVLFTVWGFTVLALHIAANLNSAVSHCLMQVRPWGIAQPSCHLVLIDCYASRISGSATEVEERLQRFYRPSVFEILVRHCPAFEMPPIIQSFPLFDTIKIYNTTLQEWGEDAAITASNQPRFNLISFIRVNFKDGKIPLGLLSADFPPTMTIAVFLNTNLVEIPSDLDLKWPPGVIVHFANSQLSVLPSVLVRLLPTYLVIGGNPIQSVPVEIFEIQSVAYLDIRSTNISTLPEQLTRLPSKLASINLDGTNISSFPSWVDEWLTFPGDFLYPERISAAGSPYCHERSQIFAGEMESFSSTSSSSLMNASPANWRYLEATVSCVSTVMRSYPVELEDLFSAVRVPTA